MSPPTHFWTDETFAANRRVAAVSPDWGLRAELMLFRTADAAEASGSLTQLIKRRHIREHPSPNVYWTQIGLHWIRLAEKRMERRAA